jgi:thiamine transporter ThiT
MSQQDTLGCMALRTTIVSGFLAAVTLVLAGLAHWPVERAILLSPVFVVLGGLLAFWALVAARSFRDASRPRRIAALAVTAFVVLAIVQLVLNHLGVTLPSERF